MKPKCIKPMASLMCNVAGDLAIDHVLNTPIMRGFDQIHGGKKASMCDCNMGPLILAGERIVCGRRSGVVGRDKACFFGMQSLQWWPNQPGPLPVSRCAPHMMQEGIEDCKPLLSCAIIAMPCVEPSGTGVWCCIGVDAEDDVDGFKEAFAASRCLRRKSFIACERIARWSTVLRAAGCPSEAVPTCTN